MAPRGLSLAQFKIVAQEYGRRFRQEANKKPSQLAYATVNAKPKKRIARLANATFAGQLLVIVTDNGGFAERLRPAILKITYGGWMKDTMNDLIIFFEGLTEEPETDIIVTETKTGDSP